MSLFSSNKKKILIAEDDPSLRKVLAKKIGNAGYEVIEASDGEMAINLALEQKPELVILDELMPKFTGTGVVRRIREDEVWGVKVPVFILTNIDEGTNTYQQVKDLANKYFIKSNTPLDQIMDAIKETLSQNDNEDADLKTDSHTASESSTQNVSDTEPHVTTNSTDVVDEPKLDSPPPTPQTPESVVPSLGNTNPEDIEDNHL